MKKRIASLLIKVICICGLYGCAGSAQEKTYSIKVGYGTNPGHPIDLASIEFEKQVQERAKELGYDVDVQLFPSSQLGSEKEMIELLQIGALDMCPTTTGPLGLFEPTYLAFDLPYLFLNTDQADKVLDGEIGEEMLASMEDIGIRGLSWWENGFRELTNNKRAITKPEDLKGIKLRTMENDVHIDFFSSLGSSPTPLGFGEIYTSLQSGVIDGQENPLSIIATNKFYEVQPYTTISDHVYSPVAVLYSKKLMDDLPEELQEIVKEVAYEVRIYERVAGRSQEQEYIDEIATKSEIHILSDDDKLAFQEAAQDTYKKFESTLGKEFMDRVIEAASD